MTDNKTKHGGARPNSGRPKTVELVAKSHTIRLTDKQKEKLKQLGGAEWVRDMIDKHLPD
jgi:ABC-type cobalamin transport system ATPase subunit